jgi:hypothetical protein
MSEPDKEPASTFKTFTLHLDLPDGFFADESAKGKVLTFHLGQIKL